MKKLLYLIVIIPYLSFANHIDKGAAKYYAKNFLTYKAKGLVDISTINLYKESVDASRTCFYIFNFKHGFVIISAEDNVEPVLGYSTESTFDSTKTPSNVKSWLDNYKNQIKFAVSNNLQPSQDISNKWLSLRSSSQDRQATVVGVSPLIATTWAQDAGYNAYCPYDNTYNEKVLTGCVATAMAQVIKYWNYPVHAFGQNSYFNALYGTQTFDFNSYPFNFDLMSNNVSTAYSGVLSYACGVAVNMNYGVAEAGGSGSYVTSLTSPITNCAEYAMKTYFRYHSSKGVERFNYTASSWISLIEHELDSSRPVIYAGYNPSEGHCFVADGYDANNFIHFNWGWAGSFNGYFNVDNLNPGTESFNNNQDAIINIKPDGVIWTGMFSGDWNNGNNWNTYFVPTSKDSVIIPAFTPYNPIISSGETGYCKSIRLKPNVYMSVLTGGKLIIGQ